MNRALHAAGILLISTLAGCGGGGGGGGGSGGGQAPFVVAPSKQVLPASYDFGRVTTGNTPSPLEVTIRNAGNATLNVASIAFTAGSSAAYTLNLASGTRPCGSGSPTIAAGDSCTFRVAFNPPSNGTYTANVQITSNDAAAPSFTLPITGTAESVAALAVRINQVDTSCPNNAATAYVSVTDQGGFPLTGLGTGNFDVFVGASTNDLLLSATRIGAAYKVLAISAVVDNSGSITNQPVAYNEMKAGFATLFNGMRANDVGQLIDFGTQFRITVPFPAPSNPGNPTNKTALVNGLAVPWTGGVGTLLYDTVYRAIDDTALQTAYRRAVVLATDGVDMAETGGIASVRTLNDVINNAIAKKVPVFAIGIGTDVNAAVLEELARRTGGVFYRANTSQNLATIYTQLSALLFEQQYVLTFNQPAVGAAGTVSPLRVDAVGPTGLTGTASSTITSCN